eukprot:TRINITY_DN31385_c0_g1_i1.p1 TRINITY_DN31385_c0_g1~~TRINITY_DN31385_c0_g1_i1.p1  ORF type:complete len:340 (+),score=73.72 TRINITY_DN31385_c0_g1_i1:81-1100(+)
MSTDADMKIYQRRGHLGRAFPRVQPYLLNCCANDSFGLDLEGMLKLMKEKWLPMEERLTSERAKLVAVLEENPPSCYVEEEEGSGEKKAVKKKKSRLQGGGGVTKKVSKPAPKQGGEWAPTSEQAVAVARPIGKSKIDVIRPGLVIMKKIIPLEAQQHFADVSVSLGTPTNGLSGGWYTADKSGGKNWNTGEGWGQMTESMKSFPKQYRDLCSNFLRMATASTDLPWMDPDLVLLNFYTPENPGIYWHRDNSAQEKRSVELGLPVVSVSIGDSCVFAWHPEPENPVQELVLDSGDVLIFGGPSRLILHSVPKIYANTAPKGLKMPKGRLNITFRDQSTA